MDPEQFCVEPANMGWLTTDNPAVQPVLEVNYEGTTEQLATAVRPRMRDDLDGDELDVSCRVVESPSGDQGILTVSDRITGTHVFEASVEVSRLQSFIRAVRAYSDRTGRPPQYELHLNADDTVVGSATTGMLVMYDPDGVFRREASLIPGELEL